MSGPRDSAPTCPPSRSARSGVTASTRELESWSGGSEAVAGSDALPHVGERAQLLLGEAQEEVLAHDREVRAARLADAPAPRLRQAGEGAAGVVFAGAALQEVVALEAVDEPGQAAARKLRLLGEVAHSHSSAARLVKVVQHLIGAERQAVRLLQGRVQPFRQARVCAEQASPRAQLADGQHLRFPRRNLDGGGSRHDGLLSDPSGSEHSTDAHAAPDVFPHTRAARRHRVARHAHHIISGCSGRRAYRAQRGIRRKRSGARAMYRFAGKTAASRAMRYTPATRRAPGRSTAKPPAISATPLTSTISLASRCRLGGTICL